MEPVNNKELFSFMLYTFLIKISGKSLFVRIAWMKTFLAYVESPDTKGTEE